MEDKIFSKSFDLGYVYWRLPFWRILSDFDKAEKIMKNKGAVKNDIARGYAFALASSVSHQLWWLVRLAPSVLGLERTWDVERAFQRELPYRKYPDGSPTGKLIKSIGEANREFLEVKEWTQLKKKVKKLNSTLYQPFKRSFEETVKKNPENEIDFNREGILKAYSAYFTFILLHDKKHISLAFLGTYRSDGFKGFLRPNIERRFPRRELLPGFLIAIETFWNNLLGGRYSSLPFLSKINNAKSWEEFDSNTYNKIKEETISPLERKMGRFDEEEFLVKTHDPNPSIFEPIHPKISETEGETRNKLEEVFQGYDVELVDLGRPYSSYWLISWMEGFKEFEKLSDPVEVIRFVHEDNNRNLYSYAFNKPMNHPLGDLTRWKVFWKIAADGGFNYRKVENYLREAKEEGYVKIREHEINPKELLEYCKDQRLKDKEDEVEKLKQERAELKGIAFELLVDRYFKRKGYNSKWREESLGEDKEIDLIVWKKEDNRTKVKIIECQIQLSAGLSLIDEVLNKKKLFKKNLDKIEYLPDNDISLEGMITTLYVPIPKEPKKLLRDVRILDLSWLEGFKIPKKLLPIHKKISNYLKDDTRQKLII